jgi:hypothetical protein
VDRRHHSSLLDLRHLLFKPSHHLKKIRNWLIFLFFKGQIKVVKDMVISSNFLPPMLLNHKFILSMKAKGKIRAKGPLIQLYHYKFTGAIIGWMFSTKYLLGWAKVNGFWKNPSPKF